MDSLVEISVHDYVYCLPLGRETSGRLAEQHLVNSNTATLYELSISIVGLNHWKTVAY